MLLAPGSSDTAIALVDAATGEEWPYGALRNSVQRFARGMATSRKSLVLCLCRNDLATVLGYLASLAAGHAVMLVDRAASDAFLDDILDRYRPDFVLGWPLDRRPVPAASTVGESTGGLSVVSFDRSDGPVPHPDLAVLLPTSGTTGSPKFVRLSAEAVEQNAASIAEALSIGPDERAVSSLPLHYSYGLSVLNSHLLRGATVVLTDRGPLDRAFWDVVRDHGCTSFAGVPYSYQLLERIGIADFDLPALRTMTQAGGKLDPERVARFHRLMTGRGGQFFVMYGQTEATARIAILPSDALPEKLGSAGRAIPGGTLEIEVDGVVAAEPGATGEIVYSGPNVMLGYATAREDLALGDELGGRLHTGDLGHLDADGYLFVTGRTKRISKVSGYRIDLDQIEARLVTNGPTAVVGTDQAIFVFCEYGDAATLEEIRRALARSLGIHFSVVQLRRVDALPRNANGKIDYGALEGMVR